MQQKITFSEACRLIAERTGIARQDVDEFLRALFTAMADELEKGETVRIKGIGAFKTTSISERKSVDVNTGREIILPSRKKISFIPSKGLSLSINAPFAAFEAIELSDDLTEEALNEIDSALEQKEDHQVATMEKMPEAPLAPFLESQQQLTEPDNSHDETIYVETAENVENTVKQAAEEDTYNESSHLQLEKLIDEENKENYSPCDNYETADESECDSESVIMTENTITTEDNNIYESDHVRCRQQYILERKKRRRFAFVIGFMCAVLLICVLGVLMLLLCPNMAQNIKNRLTFDEQVQTQQTSMALLEDSTAYNQSSVNNTETIPAITPTAVKAEQENIVPTEPSDKPVVYDYVSTTRYLTTIARQHYGNQYLWPYIYEENKEILGHPNAIKPGTRVVVPDLKKYGVDPHNKKDIEDAKKKGAAIYARYPVVPDKKIKK